MYLYISKSTGRACRILDAREVRAALYGKTFPGAGAANAYLRTHARSLGAHAPQVPKAHLVAWGVVELDSQGRTAAQAERNATFTAAGTAARVAAAEARRKLTPAQRGAERVKARRKKAGFKH